MTRSLTGDWPRDLSHSKPVLGYQGGGGYLLKWNIKLVLFVFSCVSEDFDVPVHVMKRCKSFFKLYHLQPIVTRTSICEIKKPNYIILLCVCRWPTLMNGNKATIHWVGSVIHVERWNLYVLNIVECVTDVWKYLIIIVHTSITVSVSTTGKYIYDTITQLVTIHRE